MKPSRQQISAAIGALTLVLLGSAAASAADPVATGAPAASAWASAVVLEVEAIDAVNWQLRARVLDAAGEPMAAEEVLFSVAVDFLGPGSIRLGSARTDVTGLATLTYRPTWSGVHALTAQPSRTKEGAVVAGRLSLQVDGVSPPIGADPKSLPVMRAWAVPAAAFVVVAVWIVLGLLFVGAVVGIRRSGGSAPTPSVIPVQEPPGGAP